MRTAACPAHRRTGRVRSPLSVPDRGTGARRAGQGDAAHPALIRGAARRPAAALQPTNPTNPTAHGFLDWRDRIEAVGLVRIDGLELQPFQAGLHAIECVRATCPGYSGPGPVSPKTLAQRSRFRGALVELSRQRQCFQQWTLWHPASQ